MLTNEHKCVTMHSHEKVERGENMNTRKKWLAGILVLIVMLSMSGCGKNAGSTKGTYKDPYSLEDSFEFTAGDYVPFSHLQPSGPQVTDPIKFRISNIQVKQWTVTEFSDWSDYLYEKNGKQNEHWYFVTYDLEIVESDVSETVDLFSEYLSVACLGADGQRSRDSFPPDHVPSELTDGLLSWRSSVMPLEGNSWGCYTWLEPDNAEELEYVLFSYFGQDAEKHDIYVKV